MMNITENEIRAWARENGIDLEHAENRRTGFDKWIRQHLPCEAESVITFSVYILEGLFNNIFSNIQPIAMPPIPEKMPWCREYVERFLQHGEKMVIDEMNNQNWQMP